MNDEVDVTIESEKPPAGQAEDEQPQPGVAGLFWYITFGSGTP